MARDDRDVPEMPDERSTRREPTDRLRGGGGGGTGAAGEPYNTRWRERAGATRPRPQAAIPLSAQEFTLWLQYGGWRIVAAAVGLVVVVATLIILTGQPSDQGAGAGLGGGEQPTLAPALELGLTPLPTVTPAPTTPTAAPAAQGVKFRVTGTGSEGLFLRSGPTRESQVLKTLPEGSEVTIVGDDVVQADRVWKNIEDAQGARGYAASDFLKQVGP